MPLKLVFTLLACVLAAGCEQPESQASATEPLKQLTGSTADIQWKLPKVLKEISGLAFDAGGQLFAHDDERGLIHVLDYDKGGIVKTFGMGRDPVRDDFEGIALVDDRVVLSTSSALLYFTEEGRDREAMLFERVDSGMSAFCEFEGLAFDAARRLLLLPCKSIRKGVSDAGLKIYAWSVDEQERAPDQDIEISQKELESATGKKRFPAAGISIDPVSGNWFLISAKRSFVLEVDPTDGLLTANPLPSEFKHPQTEGIEMDEHGRMFLADEGQQGRARLTIYQVKP